jgi:hypothetical protein
MGAAVIAALCRGAHLTASRAAAKRFCRACGHLLAGVAPASSMAASPPPGIAAAVGLVAERRLRSALFCDVVGFTVPGLEESGAVRDG